MTTSTITTDSKLRIRPRFKEQVTLSPSQIKEKLTRALVLHPAQCRGKLVQDHIILSIPSDQEHYWSPVLSLELETVEAGTMIRGLYGPKPAVWTMFVFFYSAIGFLTLMALIFGLSQWMLHMKPWALWGALMGILLILIFFAISKIGQGLSQTQMHQLKGFLDHALEPEK